MAVDSLGVGPSGTTQVNTDDDMEINDDVTSYLAEAAKCDPLTARADQVVGGVLTPQANQPSDAETDCANKDVDNIVTNPVGGPRLRVSGHVPYKGMVVERNPPPGEPTASDNQSIDGGSAIASNLERCLQLIEKAFSQFRRAAAVFRGRY